MVKLLRMVVVAVVLIVSMGCSSKIPFTQELRDKYKFNARDLSRLQYYVSDDIELTREKTGTDHEIAEGKLITEEGKIVDRVLLEEETPGVLVNKPRKYEVDISFEDDSFFPFLAGGNGKYQLKKYRGDSLKYRNKVYQVHDSSDTEGAHLLITQKSLSEVLERKKILPGRELED